MAKNSVMRYATIGILIIGVVVCSYYKGEGESQNSIIIIEESLSTSSSYAEMETAILECAKKCVKENLHDVDKKDSCVSECIFLACEIFHLYDQTKSIPCAQEFLLKYFDNGWFKRGYHHPHKQGD
ncbi:hypothetical protein PIB30_052764 [Stylosanthes scabra]|uniref:Uncharacterized protein n=1 Tax=Stylosanthes scabra TaxID=79078 RepID=A0ABU6ZH36_9FABA|nr:hypothetical protein [Stylosanthes scabra]